MYLYQFFIIYLQILLKRFQNPDISASDDHEVSGICYHECFCMSRHVNHGQNTVRHIPVGFS